ncbi:MAG: hypothetical protein ACRDVC_00160 [Acidimicrobiales bacterium]
MTLTLPPLVTDSREGELRVPRALIGSAKTSSIDEVFVKKKL